MSYELNSSRRTDLTRRRANLWLTALVLVTALSRFALSRWIEGPAIFTDECQYVEMARSLPKGRGLLWGDQPTYFPCWLYPLIISPLVVNLPMGLAHPLVQALNSLLMALTLAPAYRLARELGTRRTAVAAAALVALLPGLGYSAMVMTESLFLPVFTLAIWLIFRAILQPTARRRLLAGLACGLAFHVKPHGLILPGVVAATVVLFEADRLRRRAGGVYTRRRRWTDFGRAIGRHWLTALGWLLALSPRVFLAWRFEQHPHPWSPRAVVGHYMELAEGGSLEAGAFMLSLLAYFAGWALASGILPAWGLARSIPAALGGRPDSPGPRLMAILSGTVTILMLGLIARHTLLHDDQWRLHERYFFVVLPPVLIYFIAREPFRAGRRLGFWLRVDVAAVAVVLACLAAMRLDMFLPTDTPSLSGMLLFTQTDWIPRWMSALMAVVLAFSAICFIWGPAKPAWRWTALASLFLAFNIGFYGTQRRLVGVFAQADREAAEAIDQRLGPGEELFVLLDGMPRGHVWHVTFRNPGRAVYFSQAGQPWWGSPLETTDEGRLAPPIDADRAWLLCARPWRLNRPPNTRFEVSDLYYMGGSPPLRVDAEQWRRHVAGEARVVSPPSPPVEAPKR